MSWQFEVLLEPSSITEGPALQRRQACSLPTLTTAVMRYNAQSGEISVFRTGTYRANGLMLDKAGRLYACEGGTPRQEGGRRIVRYEPDGGVTVICDNFEGKKFNSPNDLAIDHQGRIWFTDPRYGEDRSDMSSTTSRSSAPIHRQMAHGT